METTDRSLLQLLRLIDAFFGKYRIILIAFALLGIFIGGYLDSLNNSSVQVTGTIQIGRVGATYPDVKQSGTTLLMNSKGNFYGLEPGYVMLMNAKDLFQQLAETYNYNRALSDFVQSPNINYMKILEGDALMIIVQGDNPQQTFDYLETIIKRVINQHQIPFETLKTALIERQRLIRTLLNNLLGDSKQSDISIQAENYFDKSKIKRLTEILYGINRALTPSNTAPTSLLGEIHIIPNQNNTTLIHILIGLSSGIALGFFLSSLLVVIQRFQVRQRTNLP